MLILQQKKEKMVRQFGKNERVCFVGDSITHGGTMVAAVFDTYSKMYPERRVVVYNCGIGGATLGTELKVIDTDVLSLEPTTAVVMFGMNDIGYTLYDGTDSPDIVAQRKERFDLYFERYPLVIEKLLSAGVRVILCTPTPYDEGQNCERFCQKGTAEALHVFRDFIISLGKKYDLDVVDFNTPMEALMRKVEKSDPSFSIIGPDRIHPTVLGQSAMARYFLASQGIDVVLPSVESIMDKSVCFELSDKIKEWKEATAKLRDLVVTEFLIFGFDRVKSPEEKIKYAREFISANLNDSKMSYRCEICGKYINYKPVEALIVRRVMRLAYDIYR